MELTKSENNRLYILRKMQSSKNQAMLPSEQKVLRLLLNKQAHNCCPNPQCVGYEAEKEDETICPICLSPLIKSLSSFVCDGCGEKCYGVEYPVYDENYNLQQGLKHCENCAFPQNQTT